MLDASGSMCSGENSPWENLITCVNSFIDKLASNQQARDSSRISVIIYSCGSTIMFTAEKPDSSLKSKIRRINGGTNFDAPLRDAHKIV
jgi:uncharacterized protein YegL